MTMAKEQTAALESWLPDSVVVSDLRTTIHSGGAGKVHLDTGTIKIPTDCIYDLVTKAFVEQRFDVGFGNCFRVVVAVGGVLAVAHGVVQPRYCFAILWYTADGKLITVDFSAAN